MLEDLELPSTQGGNVELSKLAGLSVVFIYPRTSPPNGTPKGWEMIPGAKGCTAESCAFRDLHEDFRQLDARIFGVSTQESSYQLEAARRLHLSYPLLSDARLKLKDRLGLETFEFEEQSLYKRATLLLLDGKVVERIVDIDDPAVHPFQVLKLIEQKYR